MKFIPAHLAFSLLLFFLTVGSASAASPATFTVTIENATGSIVTQLHMSNADTQDWGNNLLGTNVLKPGEVVDLTFDRSFMIYDLLAVYDNGAQQSAYGVNVRKTTYIKLTPEKPVAN